MFAIPLLLQHLLDTYGLRGTTLLGSCLWLSVALAGALFGKGVTSIEEDIVETTRSTPTIGNSLENEIEHPITPQHQSHEVNNGLIYSRRTSLLPTSAHYYQQRHKHLSSLDQQHYNRDKLGANITTIYEGITSSTPQNKSRRLVEIIIVYKSVIYLF
jgi:hypothetical protein